MDAIVQYRVECVWRWFRGRDNNHYPTRLVNTHKDKSVAKEESIFPQHTVLYSNCHQLKMTGGKFFFAAISVMMDARTVGVFARDCYRNGHPHKNLPHGEKTVYAFPIAPAVSVSLELKLLKPLPPHILTSYNNK